MFYSHFNRISYITEKSEQYKDFNIYNEELNIIYQLKENLKISQFKNETGKIYSNCNKYTLHLNFEEFYNIYFNGLLKDIYKFENVNFSDSVVKISSIHKNKKMITYDFCEFENILLFNYLCYLHDYCEIKPIDEIFLFGKISKLNKIQSIKQIDITNFIEMEFTKFSNNDIDNFLIYSLIYLYMIVIGENASRELCSSLKEILNIIKEKKIWIRKYLEIILNSFIDPRFSGNKFYLV